MQTPMQLDTTKQNMEYSERNSCHKPWGEFATSGSASCERSNMRRIFCNCTTIGPCLGSSLEGLPVSKRQQAETMNDEAPAKTDSRRGSPEVLRKHAEMNDEEPTKSRFADRIPPEATHRPLYICTRCRTGIPKNLGNLVEKMHGDLHGSQQTRVVYDKAATQHRGHVRMSETISDCTFNIQERSTYG
jgi:hypothetical protein